VKVTIERIVRVASLEEADRLDRADLEKDLNGNPIPVDRPMSPDSIYWARSRALTFARRNARCMPRNRTTKANRGTETFSIPRALVARGRNARLTTRKDRVFGGRPAGTPLPTRLRQAGRLFVVTIDTTCLCLASFGQT
jgi:hypothetical protein